MNRQGPNGIPYVRYTWNPMTGCEHGCKDLSGKPYCYAQEDVETRLMKNPKLKDAYPVGFMPTFHPTRLDQPFKRKKPERIFVCNMGDLFGDFVPAEWIESISQAIAKAPWHTYLFLTKNPKRYRECTFSSNQWVGTTIEHEKYYLKRSEPFWDENLQYNIKWVSMEPLLSCIPVDSAFDWIVIGERTGIQHKEGEWNEILNWAGTIIDQARDLNIPVFVKNELTKHFPIRRLPEKHHVANS